MNDRKQNANSTKNNRINIIKTTYSNSFKGNINR